ncbi:MAG: hypothetical protein ACOY3I_08455 [Verrucomicrobiota bacterium]
MASGEKQAEKLPITTSSIVTESKGTFLGLDGMGFFIVIVAFVGTMMIVNTFSDHGFPFGVLASVIVFLIMRLWMRGKPDGFLLDTILFSMRPKTFEHQPRPKRPIFKDQNDFKTQI